MSSIPLTLAEAVPLGTVLLQRLLDDAGIRSLVIKGPAFVELGVRKPKQSNDIDILIHPESVALTHRTLTRAGWVVISPWVPQSLDDVVLSRTYAHPNFPTTADVHHAFSGMHAGSSAFDAMWADHAIVSLAHSRVRVPSAPYALVVEALNRLKAVRQEEWSRAITAVREGQTRVIDHNKVRHAAQSTGALQTASVLLSSLGPTPDMSEPTAAFQEWARRCGDGRHFMYVATVARRAPQQLPKYLWHQVVLDPLPAKVWAERRGFEYRGRRQVLLCRARQLLRKLRERVDRP